MKKKVLLLLSFMLCISLCACGLHEYTDNGTESETKTYYEPSPTYQDWKYPVLEAEHGEDYVIEWVDKGMEAHVRLWLDRPEGDIYHSDVWDVKLLSIKGMYDVFLEEPGNKEYFLASGDSNNRKNWIYYDEEMPDICSLQDLRHFDSLQIIWSINTEQQSTALTDISGPEQCKNLQVFRLFGGEPDTLEPISEMTELERLSLCFTNETEVDLTPLQGLEHLFWLQMGQTDILSLELLGELDLIYLDLNCDYYHQDAHKGLDYDRISQMDSLLYINLANNLYLDYSDLKGILSELEQLETVDISYIFTEKEEAELRESFPNIRFICGYK